MIMQVFLKFRDGIHGFHWSAFKVHMLKVFKPFKEASQQKISPLEPSLMMQLFSTFILFNFVALSFANVFEWADFITALEEVQINRAVSFTILDPAIFPPFEDPYKRISNTLYVLNPDAIACIENVPEHNSLIYVRAPIRQEVLQYLQEAGARPVDISWLYDELGPEAFAVSRLELVKNDQVLPNSMWYYAIKLGDVDLFNYLVHSGKGDIEHQIPTSGTHFFSVLGFCIHKWRLDFIKTLFSVGVSAKAPASDKDRTVWGMLVNLHFYRMQKLLSTAPEITVAFLEDSRDEFVSGYLTVVKEASLATINEVDEALSRSVQSLLEAGYIDVELLKKPNFRGRSLLNGLPSVTDRIALPRTSSVLAEFGAARKSSEGR